MTMTNRRSAQVAAYVTPERKEQLAKLARSQGVSYSDAMDRLIADAVGAPTLTAGEYIRDYFMTDKGMLRRAAELTTDIVGVLPTPIENGLVAFRDATRPLATASNAFAGPRPMPASGFGKTLTRSRATQRATTAVQSTENTALSSQKMTVVGDTITKKTFGGFVDLTEQDVDWTDGVAIQDVLEDLAVHYGEQTDAELATGIGAAATNTVTCSLTATSDVFHAKVAEAATTVLTNAKRKPDAILVAPDRWQYVLGLTDANKAVVYVDGRPLTLPLVVSPSLVSNFIAVASMAFVETWEQDKGLAKAEPPPKGASAVTAGVVPMNPTVLTYTVAYRGYWASKVYAQGLCALVP